MLDCVFLAVGELDFQFFIFLTDTGEFATLSAFLGGLFLTETGYIAADFTGFLRWMGDTNAGDLEG